MASVEALVKTKISWPLHEKWSDSLIIQSRV